MGRRLGALISNGVHQLGNTVAKGPISISLPMTPVEATMMSVGSRPEPWPSGHKSPQQSPGRWERRCCVAAVADDGLGMAVDQMVFGHHNGGTLDLVLGVDAAAVHMVSLTIIARSDFVLFFRMPHQMPPARNPLGHKRRRLLLS